MLTIILGSTLGGYGLLSVAMGTPTPLVVVIGRSMETTYYQGDLLLIQSRPQEEIHVNDIIVFEDPEFHYGIAVVHRVIEIQIVNGTYYFYTKGDNNLDKDNYTRTIDEIMGVVVGGIPWIGNISLVMKDYWNIVLPAMIFLLLVVPEIWERYIRPPADDE